jgi:hypothetical protein
MVDSALVIYVNLPRSDSGRKKGVIEQRYYKARAPDFWPSINPTGTNPGKGWDPVFFEVPMVRIVSSKFDKQHPLGVKQVTDTVALVKIIEQHVREKGERYCPFFASLPGGIRLERWVALCTGDRLLVRTVLGAEPEAVQIIDALESRYLGRFLKEGRLYYDAEELELPSHSRSTSFELSMVSTLTSMQRFS